MFETLKEIQEVTFAEVPVMECSHSSGQVIASLEISGAEVQVYKGADQATLQVLKSREIHPKQKLLLDRRGRRAPYCAV